MRYLEELIDKSKYYIFVICNLTIDGLFIILSGWVLSKVHYEWLPSIRLEGYYHKIVYYGAYCLDLSILPSLVIKLFKDICRSIKDAYNGDKGESV